LASHPTLTTSIPLLLAATPLTVLECAFATCPSLVLVVRSQKARLPSAAPETSTQSESERPPEATKHTAVTGAAWPERVNSDEFVEETLT
jgi:hypothetical protein